MGKLDELMQAVEDAARAHKEAHTRVAHLAGMNVAGLSSEDAIESAVRWRKAQAEEARARSLLEEALGAYAHYREPAEDHRSS